MTTFDIASHEFSNFPAGTVLALKNGDSSPAWVRVDEGKFRVSPSDLAEPVRSFRGFSDVQRHLLSDGYDTLAVFQNEREAFLWMFDR